MNSAKTTTKKKISEYQIEDIKEIFLNIFKKISSKIILLEIGNNFINIALAKSQKIDFILKKFLSNISLRKHWKSQFHLILKALVIF